MPDIHGAEIALSSAVLAAAILRAATPILLAAMAGLVSELAGVINVALEGLLLIAAFFGVMGSAYFATFWPEHQMFAPLVGAVLGVGASLLMSALLAEFHLRFNADIIVAGMSINLLAAGLTVFLMASITGDKGSTAALHSYALPVINVPGLTGMPALNILFNGEDQKGHNIVVWIAVLSPFLLSIGLRSTRLGIRVRAVGENEAAANVAGINTFRVRYSALLISGLLCGLGGVFLSMGYLTLFQADMSAGRGYLALAAVFLGARAAFGTWAGGLLFGASAVFAAQLGADVVPSQLVYAIPPAVTLMSMIWIGWHRKTLAHRRRKAALQHVYAKGESAV